jgi:hypothetical protein
MKKTVFALCLVAGLASCDQIVDKRLAAASADLNKTCPIAVDKETRLDSTVALPGKIFQYRYTIVNYARQEVDTAVLKKNLEPEIIQGLKTLPNMKFARENKATMQYYYRNKAGAYLMTLAEARTVPKIGTLHYTGTA